MQTAEREPASLRRQSGRGVSTEAILEVAKPSLRVGKDHRGKRGRSALRRVESIKGDHSYPMQEPLPMVLPALQQGWLLDGPLSLVPVNVYGGMKRATDVVLALVALILLMPVGVGIALLIWIEDQGPIFYWQERVGQHGKRFRFYKFRSMVTNADEIRKQLEVHNEATGPIFKIKDDPRITRVGRVLRKYSLDELPQFLNVLRGEMSLVGPRPHLPREVSEYRVGQEKRLDVPPGLICLREVCGRSRLSFEEWIALDLFYVRHRNVALDLWIMCRLIPAVLSADGAY